MGIFAQAVVQTRNALAEIANKLTGLRVDLFTRVFKIGIKDGTSF